MARTKPRRKSRSVSQKRSKLSVELAEPQEPISVLGEVLPSDRDFRRAQNRDEFGSTERIPQPGKIWSDLADAEAEAVERMQHKLSFVPPKRGWSRGNLTSDSESGSDCGGVRRIGRACAEAMDKYMPCYADAFLRKASSATTVRSPSKPTKASTSGRKPSTRVQLEHQRAPSSPPPASPCVLTRDGILDEEAEDPGIHLRKRDSTFLLVANERGGAGTGGNQRGATSAAFPFLGSIDKFVQRFGFPQLTSTAAYSDEFRSDIAESSGTDIRENSWKARITSKTSHTSKTPNKSPPALSPKSVSSKASASATPSAGSSKTSPARTIQAPPETATLASSISLTAKNSITTLTSTLTRLSTDLSKMTGDLAAFGYKFIPVPTSSVEAIPWKVKRAEFDQKRMAKMGGKSRVRRDAPSKGGENSMSDKTIQQLLGENPTPDEILNATRSSSSESNAYANVDWDGLEEDTEVDDEHGTPKANPARTGKRRMSTGKVRRRKARSVTVSHRRAPSGQDRTCSPHHRCAAQGNSRSRNQLTSHNVANWPTKPSQRSQSLNTRSASSKTPQSSRTGENSKPTEYYSILNNGPETATDYCKDGENEVQEERQESSQSSRRKKRPMKPKTTKQLRPVVSTLITIASTHPSRPSMVVSAKTERKIKEAVAAFRAVRVQQTKERSRRILEVLSMSRSTSEDAFDHRKRRAESAAYFKTIKAVCKQSSVTQDVAANYKNVVEELTCHACLPEAAKKALIDANEQGSHMSRQSTPERGGKVDVDAEEDLAMCPRAVSGEQTPGCSPAGTNSRMNTRPLHAPVPFGISPLTAQTNSVNPLCTHQQHHLSCCTNDKGLTYMRSPSAMAANCLYSPMTVAPLNEDYPWPLGSTCCPHHHTTASPRSPFQETLNDPCIKFWAGNHQEQASIVSSASTEHTSESMSAKENSEDATMNKEVHWNSDDLDSNDNAPGEMKNVPRDVLVTEKFPVRLHMTSSNILANVANGCRKKQTQQKIGLKRASFLTMGVDEDGKFPGSSPEWIQGHEKSPDLKKGNTSVPIASKRTHRIKGHPKDACPPSSSTEDTRAVNEIEQLDLPMDNVPVPYGIAVTSQMLTSKPSILGLDGMKSRFGDEQQVQCHSSPGIADMVSHALQSFFVSSKDNEKKERKALGEDYRRRTMASLATNKPLTAGETDPKEKADEADHQRRRKCDSSKKRSHRQQEQDQQDENMAENFATTMEDPENQRRPSKAKFTEKLVKTEEQKNYLIITDQTGENLPEQDQPMNRQRRNENGPEARKKRGPSHTSRQRKMRTSTQSHHDVVEPVMNPGTVDVIADGIEFDDNEDYENVIHDVHQRRVSYESENDVMEGGRRSVPDASGNQGGIYAMGQQESFDIEPTDPEAVALSANAPPPNPAAQPCPNPKNDVPNSSFLAKTAATIMERTSQATRRKRVHPPAKEVSDLVAQKQSELFLKMYKIMKTIREDDGNFLCAPFYVAQWAVFLASGLEESLAKTVCDAVGFSTDVDANRAFRYTQQLLTEEDPPNSVEILNAGRRRDRLGSPRVKIFHCGDDALDDDYLDYLKKNYPQTYEKVTPKVAEHLMLKMMPYRLAENHMNLSQMILMAEQPPRKNSSMILFCQYDSPWVFAFRTEPNIVNFCNEGKKSQCKGVPAVTFAHGEAIHYADDHSSSHLFQVQHPIRRSYSLLLVVPYDREGLNRTETLISASTLELPFTSANKFKSVKLTVPSFRIDLDRRVDLTLKRIGLKDMVLPNSLPLRFKEEDKFIALQGIHEVPYSIETAAQWNYLQLRPIEAGEDSSISDDEGASDPLQTFDTKSMTIDRPFLAVVLHTYSRTLLAGGRVTKLAR